MIYIYFKCYISQEKMLHMEIDPTLMNWNGRRPSKLGDADAQPTPGTPPAAMPVAQVSPVGNNPTHG
jgi:hypothetical protein